MTTEFSLGDTVINRYDDTVRTIVSIEQRLLDDGTHLVVYGVGRPGQRRRFFRFAELDATFAINTKAG